MSLIQPPYQTASFLPVDITNLEEGQNYLPFLEATDASAFYTGDANSGTIASLYLPTGKPTDYHYPAADGLSRDRYPGFIAEFVCSGWATSAAVYPTTASTGGPGGGAITAAQGWRYLALLWGIPYWAIQLPVPSGSVTVPGGGYFHAPGGVDGRWESMAYLSPQKAVIYAWQWIMRNAEYHRGLLEAAGLYGYHKRGIAAGASAGGACASIIGLAPNRAYEFGAAGQHVESTVPSANVITSTNIFVPWMFKDDSTFFGNLPEAEVDGGGGENTTLAATYGGAPARYKKEVSPAYLNLPGYGKGYIPPTFYHSDGFLQNVLKTVLGVPTTTHKMKEPFTQVLEGKTTLTISATQWAHCQEGGLLLKRMFPDEVELWLEASKTYYVQEELEGNIANPNAVSAIGYDPDAPGENGLLAFLRKHIGREPWDVNPPGPIHRRGQVNTTGRYVCPPERGRKGIWISNVSYTDDVGAALTNEVLEFGHRVSAMMGKIADAAAPVFFPGDGPLYLNGVGGPAKYDIVSVF